jgi:hypothetical protein
MIINIWIFIILIILLFVTGCERSYIDKCKLEFVSEDGIKHNYEGQSATSEISNHTICCVVGKHTQDVNKNIEDGNVVAFCGTTNNGE